MFTPRPIFFMPKFLLTSLLVFLSSVSFAQTATKPAVAATPSANDPQVVLHTSQGDITIELYADKSPKSVANFLRYVHEGYYGGTVFHRAIPGYLLQGGLYTKELEPRRTHSPVQSEADNGLSNLRGTLAVARGADPNSGTSQFFFNLVDNRRLDYVGNQSGLTWGYTVFGKVVQGMDVVDKIANLPTRAMGPFAADVPNPLVTIQSANVAGEAAPASSSTVATPTLPPAPNASKPTSKKGSSATHPST